MAIGDIIVGIDIGTTKVCTILGEVNNFGQIEIICSTSYKCNGLKKGKIVNEDDITYCQDNSSIFLFLLHLFLYYNFRQMSIVFVTFLK